MRDCTLPQVEMTDEDGEVHIVSSGLDARGRELPDPVPMAPPVGMSAGPTLAETIQRMLRSELLKAKAASEDFDTPEEADDFECEDDPLDALTPYEQHFLPNPALDQPVVAPGGGAGGVPPADAPSALAQPAPSVAPSTAPPPGGGPSTAQ